MKIGVLALQGAVREHLLLLDRCGVEAVPVHKLGDLPDLDGLVIPGGESTAIGQLMEECGFLGPLRVLAAHGFTIYGTCAGMIILAERVQGGSVPRLGVMDITVRRNSFGRQRESFEADLNISGLEGKPLRAVFIRAPHVVETGPGTRVLARFGERAVFVQQGNLMATAFHPELTEDARIHALFARYGIL